MEKTMQHFLESCSGLLQGHVVYQEIFTKRCKWRCPPFVRFPSAPKKGANLTKKGPIHQSLLAEFAQGKKKNRSAEVDQAVTF